MLLLHPAMCSGYVFRCPAYWTAESLNSFACMHYTTNYVSCQPLVLEVLGYGSEVGLDDRAAHLNVLLL